jgi:hypothetical protein
MARHKKKRRRDVEYLYMAYLISFQGLDCPTIVRGWIHGTDRREVETEAERWCDEKTDELEKQSELPITVRSSIRWIRLSSLTSIPDFTGVEDIRAYFEGHRDEDEEEDLSDPAMQFFEEEMKGFSW